MLNNSRLAAAADCVVSVQQLLLMVLVHAHSRDCSIGDDYTTMTNCRCFLLTMDFLLLTMKGQDP